MQTNVVTVVAASEAVKARPVTVTGVPAARLALDEVTFGVHVVVVVPPAMAPFREAKWKTRPEYEG